MTHWNLNPSRSPYIHSTLGALDSVHTHLPQEQSARFPQELSLQATTMNVNWQRVPWPQGRKPLYPQHLRGFRSSKTRFTRPGPGPVETTRSTVLSSNTANDAAMYPRLPPLNQGEKQQEWYRWCGKACWAPTAVGEDQAWRLTNKIRQKRRHWIILK